MIKLLLILIITDIECGVLKKKFQKNFEEAGYFEGDMMKSPLFDGLLAIDKKWPNGTVPYEFESNYSELGRVQFERAIHEFHLYTCIKFKEREKQDKDYILIQDSCCCSSFVGRQGGCQVVNLNSSGCIMRIGVIQHELMHALGFFHEQSRKDRDKYINIIWDNIEPEYKDNFEISRDETSDYGIPYNPKSIMHYAFDAFSKSKSLHTIEAKDKTVKWNQIGQRINFSANDIKQIRKMYNCTEDPIFNFDTSAENE